MLDEKDRSVPHLAGRCQFWSVNLQVYQDELELTTLHPSPYKGEGGIGQGFSLAYDEETQGVKILYPCKPQICQISFQMS